MADELVDAHRKLFDDIQQADESGDSLWSARNLQIALGYKTWENFENAINRAKESLSTSDIGISIESQFRKVTKQRIRSNQSGEYTINIPDYHLTRYACYLIAQNGDVTKKEIADAQVYFAIQTYRQEQMTAMTAEQKRLYIRSQVTKENVKLQQAAKDSGDYRFGTFYDAGYLGLYGMTGKAIKKHKDLGEHNILDKAGSTELAANLFRITQTQEKLKQHLDHGRVLGDVGSAQTHFMVGGKVRQTIKDIGGTLPEALPPETESIKELEKRLKVDDKKKLTPAEKKLKISGGFDATMSKVAKAKPPKE
ncbi:MAG: DNA damage-inducible protein D [Candidatus Saccharimonadales bacterium]